jgi:hypothetical protein
VGGAGTLGANEDCNLGEVAYVAEGGMGLHLDQHNTAAWGTQEGSCVVLERKDSPWEENCRLEKR